MSLFWILKNCGNTAEKIPRPLLLVYQTICKLPAGRPFLLTVYLARQSKHQVTEGPESQQDANSVWNFQPVFIREHLFFPPPRWGKAREEDGNALIFTPSPQPSHKGRGGYSVSGLVLTKVYKNNHSAL